MVVQQTYERKSTMQKAELLLNLKMDSTQTIEEFLTKFDIAVSKLQEMDAELDEDFLCVIIIDGAGFIIWCWDLVADIFRWASVRRLREENPT